MLPRTSRLLLALSAVLLLGAFVLPLWSVDLNAPQYPEGLGMLIRVNTVTGRGPNDLDSINNLNHYIGMKRIVPEAIPELRFMPYVLAGLVALGAVAAATGRRRLTVAWLVACVGIALAGLADFYRWGYDYGHDLDAVNAIIKIPGMSYQPPLLGTKQLLNFTATSLPAGGAICIAVGIGLGALALFLGRSGAPRRLAAQPSLALSA